MNLWLESSNIDTVIDESNSFNTSIHFDYESLKQNMLGDQLGITSMLVYLKEDHLSKDLEDLGAAIASEQDEDVFSIAHKIKGTGLTSSMPRLTALAAQLENIKPLNYTLAQSILDDMQQEHNMIMNALLTIDIA